MVLQDLRLKKTRSFDRPSNPGGSRSSSHPPGDHGRASGVLEKLCGATGKLGVLYTWFGHVQQFNMAYPGISRTSESTRTFWRDKEHPTKQVERVLNRQQN